MTTVISCVMDKGNIVPIDRDRIEKWKASHKQGEHFDMILDDGANTATTPLAKKYWAIRDEYAAINGYSKPYAHAELKHLFGVTYPVDAPPPNRSVRLVETYGSWELQLSITDYTTDELNRLVDGAGLALQECSV